eukprot:GFUD01004154.1.p1 GENE.GFUD01004154.1~~GFUD01004154.1.p1  ORF type:complete len:416 (-),score=116.83 GFUD01004154.1:73-1320(-)
MTLPNSMSSSNISSMMNQSKQRMSSQMRNINGKQENKIPTTCHAIPLSVLDELASRFLINMPLEERDNLIRVCFQLELAHWFYIDFYVSSDPSLVEGSMKEFAAHMFHHVPFLQKYSDQVDEVVEMWREYKLSVPVNGAIILNTTLDKVLMVQGFNAKSGWAFPKGKVNEGEEPHICASREVMEETGFDVGQLIQQKVYLEQVVNNQTVRLYLVAGVSEKNVFCPRSRGEISSIQWWDLASLPTRVGDKSTRDRLGLSAHMFYNVIPFIRCVQKWAVRQKKNVRNKLNALPVSLAREGMENFEIKNSNTEDEITQNIYRVVEQNHHMERKDDNSRIFRDGFYPPSWQNFSLEFNLDKQKASTGMEGRTDPQSAQHTNVVSCFSPSVAVPRPTSWQHFKLDLLQALEYPESSTLCL